MHSGTKTVTDKTCVWRWPGRSISVDLRETLMLGDLVEGSVAETTVWPRFEKTTVWLLPEATVWFPTEETTETKVSSKHTLGTTRTKRYIG